MKKIILITALLALTGCASVYETHGADGRKAYAINCSGKARGWDKCLQAAGEKCGELGYDILDRNSEDTATITGGSNSQFGGNTNGFSGSSHSGIFGTKSNERSMLIACKRK
jgi:hypothetical protein